MTLPPVSPELAAASSLRRGFTLVELLVVVAIFVIMAAGLLPIVGKFLPSQSVETYRQNVVQALEIAQHRAVVGERDSAWGVKINPHDYVLFAGASYATRNTTYDKTYAINQAYTMSGMTEVDFHRLTGMPGTGGIIYISHGLGGTKTIVLTVSGMIQGSTGGSAAGGTSSSSSVAGSSSMGMSSATFSISGNSSAGFSSSSSDPGGVSSSSSTSFITGSSSSGNMSSSSCAGGSPDLSVTTTTPVSTQGSIIYNGFVTATNGSFENVTVTITVTQGATLNPGTSPFCTLQGTTVTCAFGTLACGSSSSYVIDVHPAQSDCSGIVYVQEISGTTTGGDTNPSNNYSDIYPSAVTCATEI